MTDRCAKCDRATRRVTFTTGRRLVIDAQPSERGHLVVVGNRAFHEAAADAALLIAAGPNRYVAHSTICGEP
jgi:hypothetical protein